MLLQHHCRSIHQTAPRRTLSSPDRHLIQPTKYHHQPRTINSQLPLSAPTIASEPPCMCIGNPLPPDSHKRKSRKIIDVSWYRPPSMLCPPVSRPFRLNTSLSLSPCISHIFNTSLQTSDPKPPHHIYSLCISFSSPSLHPHSSPTQRHSYPQPAAAPAPSPSPPPA